MIKLQIKSQGDYSLIRSHNSFKDIGPVDMSNVLKQSLRQGTTIMVENSNTRPEPHRGDYYLLFMQEYAMVYLFYLDVKGVLRIVYSGHESSAAKAVYQYIANETNLTILKSDSKRAYRVAKCVGDDFEVVANTYKNKSSQVVPQVYMNFFEAINLAVYNHSKHPKTSYVVISPKGTIMFKVKAN